MVDYIDMIRTILISFIITLILGPIIIPMLNRLKIGQNVRDDGPKSHLVKSGTPTMGGIIMLIALLITTVTSGMLNSDMYILLISTFGFGFIGFIDDYMKIINKRSLGLKAHQKLIGQIVLAVLLAVTSLIHLCLERRLLFLLSNRYLDLGILCTIYSFRSC